MPRAWQWVAVVTAALALLGSVSPLFDLYPLEVVLVVLVAGILIPIWAVWFASRAWEIWPPSEAVVTDPAAELEGRT